MSAVFRRSSWRRSSRNSRKPEEALQDSNETLQELADERRETVENVRQTLDLTNGQIRAAFEILGETDIPSEQLASKLVEIATRFKDLQSIAATQPGDTPEIISLKEQAEAATKAGELDKADALLAEIVDKQAALEEQFASTVRRRWPRAATWRLDACVIRRRRSILQMLRTRFPRAKTMPISGGTICGGKLRRCISRETNTETPRRWRPRSSDIGTCWTRLLEPESPLDWAGMHNDFGNTLVALGVREGSTARLEEAVAAYRAALEERTRERVPLDWAATQSNLGVALWALGENDSGTARLEEAVAAYRAALEERTREREPLDWALTQNNLGNALRTLGQRESETARLEEAVAAYRLALEELTRERTPLEWARAQYNLGFALWELGERESGTARLEEAVLALGAAMEEWTRERVPLHWAVAQNALGNALWTLGVREERHGAPGGGGCRIPRGAGGVDPRARAVRLGDDPKQSQQRTHVSRRARERHRTP